jgi:tetratricopeptide (TPR) repeat protein
MKNIFLYILLILLFTTSAFAQLDTKSIIYKGRYDIFNKEYQHAIEKFNSVITVKPELVEPYFYRAIAKYELKDYKGSEKDFLKVIAMNSFYISAYHYLGIVYSSMSDYNLALKNFDKALELSPYDASIFLSRGITKLQIKNTNGAIEDFDKALKLNAQLPELYLNKGIAYMLKDDNNEAVNQFNKAINLNVFYADAFARRGIANLELKNKEIALEDLSQAIKLESKNSIFYYWRAHLYYEEMLFDKAIADYDRVISFNPNNALVYFNRALIKAEIGLYNDAIEDYDKVIELNPQNLIPYFNKAIIRINSKDYLNAISDLDGAISVYPNFSKALEMRSMAKSKLGDEKGAYLDKLKAEKIVNEGLDNALDTNDFNKLLEFDDDFLSTKVREKNINKIDDIVFTIVEKAESEKLELKKYYYNFKEDVNELIEGDYKIILSTKSNNISKDELLALKKEFETKTIDENAYVYFLKGIIETELKNYNQAIENFKLILLSNKDFAPAQLCFSNIIKHKIEYENDISNLEISVKIDGMQSNYNVQNNQDFNFALLDNYSKIKEKNEIVNYNLGNYYANKEQYYTAIFYYNKAINENNKLSSAYFNRGLCFIKIKQNEKACENFSKAGKLGIIKAYDLIEKYGKK